MNIAGHDEAGEVTGLLQSTVHQLRAFANIVALDFYVELQF